MLMNAVAGDGDASAQVVEIVGGNCYIRSEPNTSGAKLGVAHAGDKLTYRGEISEDGWYAVDHNGAPAWVSGKYAKIA
nr:MAG TPA: SH3 domain protein [Caudoviricetes sp.]